MFNKNALAYVVGAMVFSILIRTFSNEQGSFFYGLLMSLIYLAVGLGVWKLMGWLLDPPKKTWFVYLERDYSTNTVFGPFSSEESAARELEISPLIGLYIDEDCLAAYTVRYDSGRPPEGIVQISYEPKNVTV